MAKLFLSFSFLIFLSIMSTGCGDLGTAALLKSPYIPNACGFDGTQLPADNMFAAAGEALWDNGAACGRKYQVACTSSATPGACILPRQIIKVVIVDYALNKASLPSKNGTLIFISRTGYLKIANGSVDLINIDYRLFS